MSEKSQERWIPLESDPDVLSDYLEKLCPSTDRYVIDIPVVDAADEFGIFEYNDVLAYIFLYRTNNHADDIGKLDPSPPEGLFYMKQHVRNACGSVALYHAFINTANVDDNSPIGRFYHAVKGKSPEERADVFAADASTKEIHHTAAVKGQSSVPALDEVEYHYVALVPYQGVIYELDGAKQSGPISHGPTADFKRDALKVMKAYMQRDPDNLTFSILALCSPKV